MSRMLSRRNVKPDIKPEKDLPDDLFIEIEYCQKNKHGQDICGDYYMTHKLVDEEEPRGNAVIYFSTEL